MKRTGIERFIILTSFFLLLAPLEPKAETFGWFDENGVYHVTEDITNVPEQFRDKVIKMKSGEGSGDAKKTSEPAAEKPSGTSKTLPSSSGDEILRRSSEGTIETVESSSVTESQTGFPAATPTPLERDNCGYDKRHWEIRLVDAYNELSGLEDQMKSYEENKGVLTMGRPKERIKYRIEKDTVKEKQESAKKKIEVDIPADAKKCATPSSWLTPPVRKK